MRMTTDWRAVCGRTARSVWRAGGVSPSRLLSPLAVSSCLPPRMVTAGLPGCAWRLVRANTRGGGGSRGTGHRSRGPSHARNFPRGQRSRSRRKGHRSRVRSRAHATDGRNQVHSADHVCNRVRASGRRYSVSEPRRQVAMRWRRASSGCSSLRFSGRCLESRVLAGWQSPPVQPRPSAPTNALIDPGPWGELQYPESAGCFGLFAVPMLGKLVVPGKRILAKSACEAPMAGATNEFGAKQSGARHFHPQPRPLIRSM